MRSKIIFWFPTFRVLIFAVTSRFWTILFSVFQCKPFLHPSAQLLCDQKSFFDFQHFEFWFLQWRHASGQYFLAFSSASPSCIRQLNYCAIKNHFLISKLRVLIFAVTSRVSTIRFSVFERKPILHPSAQLLCDQKSFQTV